MCFQMNGISEQVIADLAIQNLDTEREYKLFSMLRPSITIDGNQWCVLYGENLQDGVAGFGDSPHDAVMAFNQAWRDKLPATK